MRLLAFIIAIALLSRGAAQRFLWLGSLPEGGESRALAVSADGTVVVGWATLPRSIKRCAFRWTASAGMQCLGTLGGVESEAHDVSADGSVIVGWAHNTQGVQRAFRWTAEQGMQDLGTLGGRWSIAYGVSADGRVVIGASETVDGATQAFRWTAQEGMRPLAGIYAYDLEALGVSADGSVVVGSGVTIGYPFAFHWRAPRTARILVSNGCATDVSADGEVVVGTQHYIWSDSRAFRWTSQQGIRHLAVPPGALGTYAWAISADGQTVVGEADLPGSDTLACRWTADGRVELLRPPIGYESSIATDVSADGSVVVGAIIQRVQGAGYYGPRQRAFIWTAATGMRDLGALGGTWSFATDVSADGKTVVGVADGTLPVEAFIWTEATGMQRLGPTQAVFSKAYAVSANGSTVAGEVYFLNRVSRAFRWTIWHGFQELGTLGGASSGAYDVSADGTVIVGWSETPESRIQAFRWTPERGMQGLGYLTSYLHSEARAVSPDGRVIVGRAMRYYTRHISFGDDFGFSRGFRWTRETGPQGMGDEGRVESFALGLSADGNIAVGGLTEPECVGYHDEGCYEYHYYWFAALWTPSTGWISIGTHESVAFAASADGSIVVGMSGYPPRAMRWTARQSRWEDLNVVYGHLLPPAAELRVAYAISPNGRYIVGEGYDTFRGVFAAFLLDTRRDGDVNADGCVDEADLLRVLTDFGIDGYRSIADDNGDGVVDDSDLLLVLFNFGSGC